MITVPEVVNHIIKRVPLVEEGLAQGIINLSAFARIIRPKVQQRLLKNVQLGAIVMALKRRGQHLKTSREQTNTILQNLQDITIRSNLAEFTYTNSDSIIEKQQQLLKKVSGQRNLFLTVTHGVFETTIIVSSFLSDDLQKIFQGETLRSKFENLSAITLLLPKETVFIPGVYYAILKTLAWEGINIIEVVSNYTELTIILEKDCIDQAFSALKDFTKESVAAH